MKLTINNFGPVKGKQNYQIDLSKDFTLVTGGNGLGKTYLGYIIYGLIKRINEPFSRKNLSDIFGDIESTKLSKDNPISFDLSFENVRSLLDSLVISYKESIHVYMGIDRHSANMLFKDLSIEFLNLEAKYDQFLKNSAERTINFGGFGSMTILKDENTSLIKISVSNEKITAEYPMKMFLNTFFSIFICERVLINNYIRRVFYIPVERNSLYTFSKELSLKRSEMIDKMQSLLLEKDKEHEVPNYLRKNAGRYPEAIEDALRQAQDLTQLTKNDADQDFINLAAEIEKEILHGEIIVNSEGEVEFAPNMNRRKRVPVHLSASFIKTISSIIFFLKHIATKGDMVMIDEPEMNLHPNLQILFARILAQISNSGVKVWMSTHSDYIISELNNLCLVGVLNEKEKQEETAKWGYKPADYLDKSKMQAFYLNGEKYQTQVKIENLKIGDHGVDIASIDNCLNNLNTRTNELYEIYANLD
ncbi:MAG: ATP-binding protein [Prolixibacteraceae bacterium]|nr:ATP-binding protein [Prolixibacteraceae bacterium]